MIDGETLPLKKGFSSCQRWRQWVCLLHFGCSSELGTGANHGSAVPIVEMTLISTANELMSKTFAIGGWQPRSISRELTALSTKSQASESTGLGLPPLDELSV